MKRTVMAAGGFLALSGMLAANPPAQQQTQQGQQFQQERQVIITSHTDEAAPVETTTVGEVPATPPNLDASARNIDLAICLDTSGSMDGLINAARQKLWAIVNELALATPTPSIRVALLTYGNDGHTPENGWVNVDTPLTDNLDLVSERLFALTTNGGTELVARVVQTAAEELEWHPSTDALRLMIVAGNESADQRTRKLGDRECHRGNAMPRSRNNLPLGRWDTMDSVRG